MFNLPVQLNDWLIDLVLNNNKSKKKTTKEVDITFAGLIKNLCIVKKNVCIAINQLDRQKQ